MKCPQCGFENPDGFSFCGRCGTRLEATSAHSPADRQATIRQLKEAGDKARQGANPVAALEHYQQALALLDSVISASDATLQVELLKQRFDLLAERCSLWVSLGQLDRIEPDLEDMLALARRSGDGSRLSRAITTLARFYLDRRRYEACQSLLEEAVSLLHTQSDWPGEAAALADLAHVTWRTGTFDHVAEAFQRAHELRLRAADPAGLARSYFDLGLLYRDGMSHAIHAVAHFDKSIEFARHSGDAELEARALIELGLSWTRLGDYAQARTVLDEAQPKAADAAVSAQLLITQAEMLRETQSSEAAQAAERAVVMTTDLRQPDLEWGALCTQVRVAHAYSEWQAVLEPIDRMQQLERAASLHAYCAIWSNSLLARSQLHTDQLDLAMATSTRAAQALQSHGSPGVPVPQAILWAHFEVLSAANDPSAFHYLRQARETMLTQANTISDSALRARFLRDVTANRSIGDDWTRRHT